MSDSSSEGSFLLEELGLNNGSKKDKDHSKKKAKPKSKKKQNSPKRKPLSLDEIMKSMGIETPNETAPTTTPNPIPTNDDFSFGTNKNGDNFGLFPSQSQIQNKQPQQQFFQAVPAQPQINLNIFENRIIDYLNRSLKTIVDEFSIEMTQIFQFNNKIDDTISSFLDSIKQTIREEINFFVDSKSSLVVVFDSFAPEFRETYYEIEKMKNLSIPKKVAEVRSATASVSSYIPRIGSRFSHVEITNELNELSSIRSRYKTVKKKIFQLKRNLFLNQVELECKSRTQKMESDILQSKMQHLENERSKLDLFEDNSNQAVFLEQNRRIRKITHDLAVLARKRKEFKQNWHLQTIKDTRNEISYYRQINNYQNDLFESKYKEMVNQKMSTILLSRSMPPQAVNNASLLLPPQSQIFTQNSMIQPTSQQIPQAQSQINYTNKHSKNRKKSPKVSEISRSDLSGHDLLNHVQEQLKKVQENNQTSLDITSHYLSNLKKKERKRAHQYITQIMDSEYDMNSLFSIT